MGNAAFVSRDIHVDQWFTEIVGVSEGEFVQLTSKENFFVKDKEGNVFLRKKGKGEIANGVCCGKFSCSSLDELMKQDKSNELLLEGEEEKKPCRPIFKTRGDSF